MRHRNIIHLATIARSALLIAAASWSRVVYAGATLGGCEHAARALRGNEWGENGVEEWSRQNHRGPRACRRRQAIEARVL